MTKKSTDSSSISTTVSVIASGSKLPQKTPKKTLADDLKTDADYELKIVYRDIDEIKFLPDNFKRHDADAVIASIRQFGFVDPVAINRTTGHDIDGNGRVEVLQIMKGRGLPAPRGIRVVTTISDDNTFDHTKWFVPTIDGVELSAIDEVGVAAALNKTNELGGVDNARMAEILDKLRQDDHDAFSATGFKDEEIDSLVKQFTQDLAPPSSGQVTRENFKPEEHLQDVTAPPATIRQVQLYYEPKQHTEFSDAVLKCGDFFNLTNPSDIVIKALQSCEAEIALGNWKQAPLDDSNASDVNADWDDSDAGEF